MTPTQDNTAEAILRKHLVELEDSFTTKNGSAKVIAAMEEYRSIGERAKEEEIAKLKDFLEVERNKRYEQTQSEEQINHRISTALSQAEIELRSKLKPNTIAENIYREIGEGYRFNGTKEQAIELITIQLNKSEVEPKAKEERPDTETYFNENLAGLADAIEDKELFLFYKDVIINMLKGEVSTQKEWISVKDSLPNNDTRVLGYSPKYGVNSVWFIHNEFPNAQSTTHWMPLPDVSNLNK